MPPRVRITQKRAQPVQDPEEDGDEEEDEEEVGVEFPANLRQRVLVCCNLGQHKSTKYALAICKDCKCCWHVECIKDTEYGGALAPHLKNKLRAGTPLNPLTDSWHCPRCCYLAAKFEALNVNKAMQQATAAEKAKR